MTYELKLLKSDEGYAVWCPALPGCWSQGESEDEALANIRDAIAEYIAADDEEGAPALAHAETRTVEVE